MKDSIRKHALSSIITLKGNRTRSLRKASSRKEKMEIIERYNSKICDIVDREVERNFELSRRGYNSNRTRVLRITSDKREKERINQTYDNRIFYTFLIKEAVKNNVVKPHIACDENRSSNIASVSFNR